MSAEMGEYGVGAYLRIINGCDFVDYNVRRPGGGLAGLDELDVIGLDFKNKVAYLCEVTTHITGLLYIDNATTIRRIKQKYEKQRKYAGDYLKDFPARHFMFWSPVVPRGYLIQELQKINGLEVVINEEYTARIRKLQLKAKEVANDTGNPFFRVLQILEHLRE
jgi:hypothetical protein